MNPLGRVAKRLGGERATLLLDVGILAALFTVAFLAGSGKL